MDSRGWIILALIGVAPVVMVTLVALLRGYDVVVVLSRDRHRRDDD